MLIAEEIKSLTKGWFWNAAEVMRLQTESSKLDQLQSLANHLAQYLKGESKNLSDCVSYFDSNLFQVKSLFKQGVRRVNEHASVRWSIQSDLEAIFKFCKAHADSTDLSSQKTPGKK